MHFLRRGLVFALVFSASWLTSQDAKVFSQSGRSDPLPLPITGKERVAWAVRHTVGTKSLVTGLFTSAIGTAENSPLEYGPHWDGFGKRYGMRLTGVATQNAMEASLGALWGENPRYFPSGATGFQSRMKHIVVMTFAARRGDGRLEPAYARFVAMPGSNFLSNAWRPDSTATTGDASRRTLLAFVSRLAGNAVSEFWPDVKKHLRHGKK
jgi:hypothetical protein